MRSEKTYILFRHEERKRLRCRFKVEQTALFGFLHPFIGIVVAVEYYPLVLFYRFDDKLIELRFEIGSVFKYVRKTAQLLRNDGIEHDIGTGDGKGGAEHPELELVAGECEGRGPVPVGCILGEMRKHVYSQLHFHFFLL